MSRLKIVGGLDPAQLLLFATNYVCALKGRVCGVGAPHQRHLDART